MHENEKIEILKALLNKSVSPAAVPGLYRDYENAVAEILEPELDAARSTITHMVCPNCLQGRHDKCQSGGIITVRYPNRPIAMQFDTAVIECLCEQCKLVKRPQEDGPDSAAVSAG